MLSFRSILFAAAALATMVSAMPTPDGGPSGSGLGSITHLESLGGLTGGGGLGSITGSGPTKRGGEVEHSPYKCFEKCRDGINPIIIKIKACVGVEGGAEKVDKVLLLSLLKELLVVVGVLLAELKLIIKVDLVLDCTLEVLAGIIGEVLILLIEVLWLVISILGFVEVAICGLIAEIGGLLCEILKLVFFLVADLLVLVVEIIRPYGDHCHGAKWDGILVILGIVL